MRAFLPLAFLASPVMAFLGATERSAPLRGDADLAALPGSHPARDDAVVIAAFSITPLGIGESVGAAVADAVRVVRASGLPNETNAMFTNVEGEWDDVMNLIRSCVIEVSRSAPRVSVVIKVDYRPGAVDALHAKVATVESHLTEE